MTFLTNDGPAPIASVADLLADPRSRPAWDGALIEADDAQCPRVTSDWHDGQGFVVHCWENQTSWGSFLVEGGLFSTPSVEVELGGQALERCTRRGLERTGLIERHTHRRPGHPPRHGVTLTDDGHALLSALSGKKADNP